MLHTELPCITIHPLPAAELCSNTWRITRRESNCYLLSCLSWSHNWFQQDAVQMLTARQLIIQWDGMLKLWKCITHSSECFLPDNPDFFFDLLQRSKLNQHEGFLFILMRCVFCLSLLSQRTMCVWDNQNRTNQSPSYVAHGFGPLQPKVDVFYGWREL